MVNIPFWLSACLKLAISVSIFSILPSYLTIIEQHLTLSPTVLNYLATTELMGFALACALNYYFLRHDFRFNDNVALALLCLCHLSSAFISDVSLFFIMRGLAGVCAGLVIVRCYEVLGAEENPDAAFGKAIAIQMLTTAVLFLLLPSLVNYYDTSIFFIALGGLVAFTLLLKPLSVPNSKVSKLSEEIDLTVVLISLSAMVMVILTHSAIWSTLGAYAIAHHIELGDQGLLFAFGTLFSVAGAILATFPVAHQRKTLILSIAIFLQCLVVSTMLTGDDMYSFIIATCIFQLLWNLIVPLVMGTMASGRYGNVVIRFTLAAQTLGAALGPLMLVPGWVLPEVIGLLLITYLLVSSTIKIQESL
ncbi:MFS transporter [Vibrio comitans]|uniref:MFS transporter n=1 Tax=Vibrio comitans TaxID=413401 RepID=UPI001FCC80BB|nr:MFS transporter [Vibrio comitans]